MSFNPVRLVECLDAVGVEVVEGERSGWGDVVRSSSLIVVYMWNTSLHNSSMNGL